MNEWQMEDIDNGLSANFEGSLSGLGVDLTSSAFNMSDAILSLSSNKLVSPDSCDSADLMPSSGTEFSFLLTASTSPAVKIDEEPLTYLNQGQPYEVRMFYLPRPSKPKEFKSIIRVSFNERRMQFMEKEHMDYWRQSRPGERILDIDLPLSYNIRDASCIAGKINAVEVIWAGGCAGSVSGADCGIFLKLHCISTEFTARKHGGEKGIPFRLQIDTYDRCSGEHLSSVAAQVKVFKPKGADRRHKTDREKLEKRSDAERSKYQVSLAHTPFKPTAGGAFIELQAAAAAVSYTESANSVKQEAFGRNSGSLSSLPPGGDSPDSPTSRRFSPTDTKEQPPIDEQEEISAGSTQLQVADWLERHRFSSQLAVLHNFNGADLLRLSRSDLVAICGTSDGIRLSNALMRKPPRPLLVFFVGQEIDRVFHPVYLYSTTYNELFDKVTRLFRSDSDKISQILLQGVNGILVCISDEMVSLMESESVFTLHVLADADSKYRIFMKPYRVQDTVQDAEA